MSDKVKQVIIVRKDLNMRKGKIGAQCAHASNAILLKEFEKHPLEKIDENDPFKLWVKGRFVKIVLYVENEEELLSIFNQAQSNGLRVSLITDAGLTEFNGVPTKTCIAIGPNFSDEIDKITKDLKLY